MPYIITTLVQLPPETNAAFEIRVQTFVSDQYYYFGAVGGSFPIPIAGAGGGAFLGYPPIEPTSDSLIWNPVAAQLVRSVTFSYQNDYYYKFLGIAPPLPAPTPFPTAGNVAIWGTAGKVLDSGLGFDIPTMNFTNLLPATVNGQAVEHSQFAALVAGVVNTVNAVVPTLGNIQLTVSNTGTAGTLQWSGLALQIPQADTDTTGLLSDTDWNTFNSKQPAGSYITALTGDATATGPGSVAITLANVNATPGSFGNGTTVPVITVNTKGLVTNVVSFTIMPPESNVTFTDITTNNSSTTKHGFLKKLSNNVTDYMDGTGNWSVPLGSGGTVTSFSSGNLSPLFTTSVATATSTPALSFTLSNAAVSTWFGNNSAIGAAAPAFNTQQALTKTDDTNVTLTLGGTPLFALMNPVSLTLGWTGTLADARIASAATWNGKTTLAAVNAQNLSVFAATTSAQLAGIISDETGSGPLVFGTQPTITELLLSAGTTTVPPLKFAAWVAGMTTPSAGSMNYDGLVPYFAHLTNVLGVLNVTQYSIVSDAAFFLAAATGVQSCFEAAGDVWNLNGNTSYDVEGMYAIQKSGTTCTTAIAFELGGGASITRIKLMVLSHAAAADTTSTANNTTEITQISSTVVTISSATRVLIHFKGMIRMNAGGTLTPQINFSAIPTTPFMGAGSYIKFTPLGTDTQNRLGNVS